MVWHLTPDYVEQLQTQLEAYRAQCQCEPSIPEPKGNSDEHVAFAHDGIHGCSSRRTSRTSSTSPEPKQAADADAGPDDPPLDDVHEADACAECMPAPPLVVSSGAPAVLPHWHYTVWDAPDAYTASCAHWHTPRAVPYAGHRDAVWHRPWHRAYCMCPTTGAKDARHRSLGAARLVHPHARPPAAVRGPR